MPTAEVRNILVDLVESALRTRIDAHGPVALDAYVGASVGMLADVRGRPTAARLLRRMADAIEAGAFSEPAGCRGNQKA